jgi:rhodanese-related sulfurtransferase
MPEKTTDGYAGDVSANEAWTMLAANPKAQLVDVRTNPEWTFVGIPDVSGIGRKAHLIEWQLYPSMTVNPQFVATTATALEEAGAGHETPIFFLCRSGARSRSAAVAMTRAGYTHAYNIAAGFEGDLDEERHRGRKGGWKVCGLPWRQT